MVFLTSFNESLNVVSGADYKIGGTSVLTSSTLGSGVTASSLTSVGTIATGVWQGTAVATDYGGTGQDFSGSSGIVSVSAGTMTTVTAPSGTIVGASDSQTLTNKTLTTAILNTPIASWLQQVRAASTANIVDLSDGVDAGATIDGVTLAEGDRVLLKNQSTASQNGIYVVAAAGNAGIRASDMPTGVMARGATVAVLNGSNNQGLIFMVDSADFTVNVGTDAMSWIEIGSGITASSVDTLSSKTIDLDSNTISGTVAEFNAALQGDDFVTLTGVETLTNKTLTSVVLTTPQINDTSSDHQYIVAVNELTADRTITLPLLSANGTVQIMSQAAVQTSLFTASEWTVYPVSTADGAVTVTLPAISATNNGGRIVIADFGGNASINNITISPAAADAVGSKGAADTDDIITGSYNTVTLMAVYNGGTNPRWIYV